MKKFIFVIAGLFVFTLGCEPRMYKESRLMMGTFAEVISPDKRAARIAFDEMRRIELIMSKYDPKSEVSKLNTDGSITAGPEMMEVVTKSIEVWEKSGRAFDITVAPLIDLWGFTARNFNVPTDDEVTTVMQLTGSDKIIVNPTTNVIQLNLSGMKVDLGGIAKGYALDCAAKKLKKAGINNCLINLGGQVYALGKKTSGPWRVAIKNPRGNDVEGKIPLQDRSMSTSGDYEQYFIHNGARYSHIIDPRTGHPAAAGIKSVTVVALDGTTADALSTAVFVLGKVKGEALAKEFPDVKIIAEE